MTESLSEQEPPLEESGVEEGEVEVLKQQETLFAVVLNEAARWREIIKDPAVRQAATAGLRTLANIGISFADTVPVAGEGPSWLADMGKFTDHWARRLGFSTDLTPDVSKRIAVGSEILEATTGTIGPTHMIETALQLKADWPRIVEGFKRLRELWNEEQADYRKHPEIAEAIDIFTREEAQ